MGEIMRGVTYYLAVVGGAVLLAGCTNTTTTNNTNTVTQQQQVVIIAPGGGASASASAGLLPPGGVYACTLEGKFKALVSTQPFTMVFSNQTGGDVSLYWLDYNGQRKLYGKIENGKARAQPTFITHPWLIADAKDACIEIAMPGRSTQTVVVRDPANPLSSLNPPSPPAKP
jgi:hypothetical protein